MSRDNQPWGPLTTAKIGPDDNGSPASLEFNDVYYNTADGLAESDYVFVQGSNLPERWVGHSRSHFCVAETGFGTGLNFLLTWQAWRAAPEPKPDLVYISSELYPLTRQDMADAIGRWPQLAETGAQLLRAYPLPLPGEHRLLFEGGRVRLDLWWADATVALQDLAGRGDCHVDAWYLDGFAPTCNQSMWTPELFAAMASLSQHSASFATFTAASQVRRDLQAAGFDVHKVTGHGLKRECLRGTLAEPTATPATLRDTPWDLPRSPRQRPTSALVLGAGLAGCHTAAALARRGIAVTVLEAATLASGGSGNDQGVLFTRLSQRHSSLVDFSLQSYRFATDFYAGQFLSGELVAERDGSLCGNFQQLPEPGSADAIAAALASMTELARYIDADEAEQRLGIAQPHGGYWFPRSGWLRAPAVCAALLEHRNITLVENCGALTLAHEDGIWHALAKAHTVGSAPCVVLAAGTHTALLSQCQWLPLQAIRGQVTQLPTSTVFSQLRACLCHDGYIAPAHQGRHCIGATFDIDSTDTASTAEDHRHNITALGTAIPQWRDALQQLGVEQLEGRAALRCTSPDYLPVIGPCPDYDAFLHDYQPLGKDAKRVITLPGAYRPGLYLSTAHGSRGLTSTPIAGELLASMICNEPLPLRRELCRALNPGRFIIRDLIRNRIPV